MPRRERSSTWWRVAATASLAGVVALATSLVVPGAAVAEVPAPGPTTSVVSVKTGGDRNANDAAAPLAGVQLGLFATEDATDPIATCTADADGDCSFVVPDTQAGGANAGTQPWVRQTGAPAGWFVNPSLRTGSGSGSGSVASPYTFQVPALVAGQTYLSTRDFMRSSSNALPTRSGGVWQTSRDNPALPVQCGADVALVLDLSASVGSDLPDLKAAADSFADALVGTPSRMAVFSFSATSPSLGADANHPELRSVSTQAGADAFKAQYADWQTSAGTNWDQALWQVAQASPTYQLVVVLTDGNPTRFGTDPIHGDGSNTHFTDVENGIFSANTVKAKGSRVVALGVGSGVSGLTALNLAAISGPVAYDGSNIADADYFQATDYAGAGTALRSLVLSQCDQHLSVVKQIVPAATTGEDVSGAQPAGEGWQFTASSSTAGVVLPGPQTTTDDGTGTVTFEPEFPTGTESGDITVTEAQHPGYSLVTQDGANAVCVNRSDGDAPVPVDGAGSGQSPGFTVSLPAGAFVACTVYNRPSAAVVVQKRWVVDGVGYANGDQPAGMTASATLTGPGDAGPTEQAWGVERTGYEPGEDATVDETTVVPEGCALASARVTAVDGDAVSAALPYTTTAQHPRRSVTVTNTVDCEPYLTLVKRVVNDDGGTASPGDWVLTADGPTSVSGTSGEQDVTDVPVLPGDYTLGEHGGPAGYEAGAWTCEDASGEAVDVSGAGVVSLEGPVEVTCTLVNDDVRSTATPTTPPPTTTAPTSSTTTPAGGGGPTTVGPGGGSSGGGALATTGADLVRPVGLAVLLLLAGTAALLVARRRS